MEKGNIVKLSNEAIRDGVIEGCLGPKGIGKVSRVHGNYVDVNHRTTYHKSHVTKVGK